MGGKWPELKDISFTGQFLAQVRRDLGVAGWGLMQSEQSRHPAFLRMCYQSPILDFTTLPSLPISPHAVD